MKDLKYFCQECKLVKSAKFENLPNPNSTIPIPTEITRKRIVSNGNGIALNSELNTPAPELNQITQLGSISDAIANFKKEPNSGSQSTKEVKERQLECEHWVEYSTPGFTDATTEHLNEFEIQEIRRTIDKSILGLNKEELILKVLLQVDIYETQRKIAAKQQKQAKYAQMYLEQLKDRYKEQLSADDQKKLDMKFAASLEQKPTANRTIERDIAKADKEANKKQQALLDAMRALHKMGFEGKDLFGKPE